MLNLDPKPSAAQITELEVGYSTGADRLLLWLPVIVTHRITEDSPLASWANMSGFLADADSCIALTARLGNSLSKPSCNPRVEHRAGVQARAWGWVHSQGQRFGSGQVCTARVSFTSGPSPHGMVRTSC